MSVPRGSALKVPEVKSPPLDGARPDIRAAFREGLVGSSMEHTLAKSSVWQAKGNAAE